MFMVPTGAAGKKFINKIARILNLWITDTPLKNNVLKAIHIIPALLIQRSRRSQKQEHILSTWESNEIVGLEENWTIQEKLPSNITPISIEKFLPKFEQLIETGNVNGALWLLTNNVSNGILTLSKETLYLLHLKHFK